MKHKHSLRFWIVFWTVSIILLVGWYFFLQLRNNGFEALVKTASFLPVSQELKGDVQAVVDIADALLVRDGKERTYLVLFQNNWELRPGGGFIGSFGVVKVKNGNILSIDVHDTANFDGRIPSTITPPYPMGETLNIDSWKLRDSNYSPDFPTNVESAVMFYEMGGGKEQFDGVFAITTNVLITTLEVTGPVRIEGYSGEYGAENAIELLQHQVEVGYKDQGIEKGDRKVVMNDLARAVLDAIGPLDISRKFQLAKVARENLYTKDIQIYFEDEELQKVVNARGWDGRVDRVWQNDYLMLVDANLGAYKSDRLIDREVEYHVDFSGENPQARLEITYTHNGITKDWKTNDYQSYLRVYVPEDAWLESHKGLSYEVQYGEVFGKKYFGTLIQVPLNTTRTFSFTYELPSSIDEDFYDLKIQKQAGIYEIPYMVSIKGALGMEEQYTFSLNRDILLSNEKEE